MKKTATGLTLAAALSLTAFSAAPAANSSSRKRSRTTTRPRKDLIAPSPSRKCNASVTLDRRTPSMKPSSS